MSGPSEDSGRSALLQGRQLRFLLYGHDSVGLGHLRRNLAIAAQLSADLPDASILIVTGCPTALAFPLPPRTDLLKLPAVGKDANGAYRARNLALDLPAVRDLRARLILQTVVDFAPHVIVVDHSPAGLAGEVVPTLGYLQRSRPLTLRICGLRDIMDDADQTRTTWDADGVYALLDRTYDRILVYGSRDVFDVGEQYRLSHEAQAKVVYCGYLRRTDTPRAPERVRRELHMGDAPLVVVTLGGGDDGEDVIRVYIDAIRARHAQHGLPFHSLIVTGPQMSPTVREEIYPLIEAGFPVTVTDFSPDLCSYLNAADAVVARGGYNTVCEILSLGKPVLLIPRVHPRREQELRARRLAARGLVTWIHPGDLTPERLNRQLTQLLASKQPLVGCMPLDMNGLSRVSRELRDLLQARLSLPSLEPASL